MVAGIIIGASIFVQPSEVNRHVPTIPGVLSAWITAGILTLFGALVCAQLSAAFPRTGGVYVFLKETLSPACGFLWGWAMFWSAHSGIIAASSVVFARYVAFFVPLGDAGIRCVAIAGILILSAVNYLGVRQGSMLQTVVTVSKVIAILLLLVIVAFWAKPAGTSTAPPAPSAQPFREFVLAVSAALFAFGGWHMVTYTAGETRDPGRTIPRALLIGTLTVTGVYVLLNAAYLYLLPISSVIGSTRVAADAAQAVAGPRGASLISALVILSASGVLNGVILAGPRTYYAMAKEGLAFQWLGSLRHAIVLQAVWSCILVATGTYRALFTRVIYTEWLFFALMAIGLMRLRRRFALVPAIFAAAAVVVAVIQIAADPVQAATGLLIVVLGLPVYFYWHAHH
ncbi:MAG: amino acid permease-associated region [Candidatus Solibacter sp.]|nr:amino acid permease-associated region [Candidatus Solibacter sp.]